MTAGARRVIIGILTASILLCALSVVYMGGVAYRGGAVRHCRSTVRGAPGDGTTGGVWLNYVWNKSGGGPIARTQHLTGAERGDALWRPVQIVSSAYFLPMYVLSRLVGPVCGYNLIIVVGFVTSGLGMWALAYYLSRSRLAALVAAVTFAYSGFTQIKSEGHISGVFLGGFPLLTLALLWLWRNPSLRRALLASFVWASLSYVDGYYLAFSFVLVGGLFLGTSIGVMIHRRFEAMATTLKRTVLWTVATGLLALVQLAPVIYTTLRNRQEITTKTGRTTADAISYSARPLEYLIPPHLNPFFRSWTLPWRSSHLHGSNYTESTIYLGWIPLLLAATAIGLVMRRVYRRRSAAGEERPPSPPPDSSLDQPVVIWGLVGVVLLGFIASLSPALRFFGIPLPMPSRLLRAVFPQLRVFSRMFVVVHTAVVALGAIGLGLLLAKLKWRWLQPTLAAIVALLSLLESLLYAPRSIAVWSYTQAPQVYWYLRARPDVREVAVYPLNTPLDDPDNSIFTFQPVLNKVMVNPVADSLRADDPSDIARGMAALTDPQTVPALRALGADTVVVETQRLGELPAAEYARLGLTPTAAFRYDRDDAPYQTNGGANRWAYLAPFYDTDVFTIEPGPIGEAVVALGDGWWPFERGGWSGSRWMLQNGQVTAVGLRMQTGTAHVSFSAHAFAVDRHVEIVDAAGNVLTTVTVPVGGTDVELDVPIGQTVELRSIEPPIKVSDADPSSGDPRELTISVSKLAVEPVGGS